MAIQPVVPDPFGWITALLAGQSWPAGNEDSYGAAAQAYSNAAAAVIAAGSNGTISARSININVSGYSTDAFNEYWSKYVGHGNASIDSLADQYRKLAAQALSARNSTEYTKLVINIQIIVVAIQLAVTAVASLFSFGAAATQVGPILAVAQFIARNAFARLVEEIAQMMIPDFVAQTIQVLDGHTDSGGYDGGKLITSAITGGLAGGLGWGAQALTARLAGATSPFLRTLGTQAETWYGHTIEGGLNNIVVTGGGDIWNIVHSGHQMTDEDWRNLLFAGANGLVTGFGFQAVHSLGGQSQNLVVITDTDANQYRGHEVSANKFRFYDDKGRWNATGTVDEEGNLKLTRFFSRQQNTTKATSLMVNDGGHTSTFTLGSDGKFTLGQRTIVGDETGVYEAPGTRVSLGKDEVLTAYYSDGDQQPVPPDTTTTGATTTDPAAQSAGTPGHTDATLPDDARAAPHASSSEATGAGNAQQPAGKHALLTDRLLTEPAQSGPFAYTVNAGTFTRIHDAAGTRIATIEPDGTLSVKDGVRLASAKGADPEAPASTLSRDDGLLVTVVQARDGLALTSGEVPAGTLNGFLLPDQGTAHMVQMRRALGNQHDTPANTGDPSGLAGARSGEETSKHTSKDQPHNAQPGHKPPQDEPQSPAQDGAFITAGTWRSDEIAKISTLNIDELSGRVDAIEPTGFAPVDDLVARLRQQLHVPHSGAVDVGHAYWRLDWFLRDASPSSLLDLYHALRDVEREAVDAARFNGPGRATVTIDGARYEVKWHREDDLVLHLRDVRVTPADLGRAAPSKDAVVSAMADVITRLGRKAGEPVLVDFAEPGESSPSVFDTAALFPDEPVTPEQLLDRQWREYLTLLASGDSNAQNQQLAQLAERYWPVGGPPQKVRPGYGRLADLFGWPDPTRDPVERAVDAELQRVDLDEAIARQTVKVDQTLTETSRDERLAAVRERHDQLREQARRAGERVREVYEDRPSGRVCLAPGERIDGEPVEAHTTYPMPQWDEQGDPKSFRYQLVDFAMYRTVNDDGQPSTRHLVVKVPLAYVSSDVTDDQALLVKYKARLGAELVNDALRRPGMIPEGQPPIDVQIDFSAADELSVDPTSGKLSVDPARMVMLYAGAGRTSEHTWYVTDGSSTFTHEWLHLLGVEDEYFKPDERARWRTRPDATGIHDGVMYQHWVGDSIEPRHLRRILHLVELAEDGRLQELFVPEDEAFREVLDTTLWGQEDHPAKTALATITEWEKLTADPRARSFRTAVTDWASEIGLMTQRLSEFARDINLDKPPIAKLLNETSPILHSLGDPLPTVTEAVQHYLDHHDDPNPWTRWTAERKLAKLTRPHGELDALREIAARLREVRQTLDPIAPQHAQNLTHQTERVATRVTQLLDTELHQTHPDLSHTLNAFNEQLQQLSTKIDSWHGQVQPEWRDQVNAAVEVAHDARNALLNTEDALHKLTQHPTDPATDTRIAKYQQTIEADTAKLKELLDNTQPAAETRTVLTDGHTGNQPDDGSQTFAPGDSQPLQTPPPSLAGIARRLDAIGPTGLGPFDDLVARLGEQIERLQAKPTGAPDADAKLIEDAYTSLDTFLRDSAPQHLLSAEWAVHAVEEIRDVPPRAGSDTVVVDGTEQLISWRQDRHFGVLHLRDVTMTPFGPVTPAADSQRTMASALADVVTRLGRKAGEPVLVDMSSADTATGERFGIFTTARLFPDEQVSPEQLLDRQWREYLTLLASGDSNAQNQQLAQLAERYWPVGGPPQKVRPGYGRLADLFGWPDPTRDPVERAVDAGVWRVHLHQRSAEQAVEAETLEATAREESLAAIREDHDQLGKQMRRAGERVSYGDFPGPAGIGDRQPRLRPGEHLDGNSVQVHVSDAYQAVPGPFRPVDLTQHHAVTADGKPSTDYLVAEIPLVAGENVTPAQMEEVKARLGLGVQMINDALDQPGVLPEGQPRIEFQIYFTEPDPAHPERTVNVDADLGPLRQNTLYVQESLSDGLHELERRFGLPDKHLDPQMPTQREYQDAIREYTATLNKLLDETPPANDPQLVERTDQPPEKPQPVTVNEAAEAYDKAAKEIELRAGMAEVVSLVHKIVATRRPDARDALITELQKQLNGLQGSTDPQEFWHGVDSAHAVQLDGMRKDALRYYLSLRQPEPVLPPADFVPPEPTEPLKPTEQPEPAMQGRSAPSPLPEGESPVSPAELGELGSAQLDALRSQPMPAELRAELPKAMADALIAEALPLLRGTRASGLAVDVQQRPDGSIQVTGHDGRTRPLPADQVSKVRRWLTSRLAAGVDVRQARTDVVGALGAVVHGPGLGRGSRVQGALSALGHLYDAVADEDRPTVLAVTHEVLAATPGVPWQQDTLAKPKLVDLAAGVQTPGSPPMADQYADLRGDQYDMSRIAEPLLQRLTELGTTGTAADLAELVEQYQGPVADASAGAHSLIDGLRERAVVHWKAAETARTAAETARTAAETARTAAETARGAGDSQTAEQHTQTAQRHKQTAEQHTQTAQRHKRIMDRYQKAASAARQAQDAYERLSRGLGEPPDASLPAAEVGARAQQLADYADAAEKAHQELRLALVATLPPVEALTAAIPHGRLPFLSELADHVKMPPDELSRLLRAQWRYVASADGLVLRLQDAGGLVLADGRVLPDGSTGELRLRFVLKDPSDMVEVPNPPTRSDEMIVGQLPQFPMGGQPFSAQQTRSIGLSADVSAADVIAAVPDHVPGWLGGVLAAAKSAAQVVTNHVDLIVSGGLTRQTARTGSGGTSWFPGAVGNSGAALFDVTGTWESWVRTAQTVAEHDSDISAAWLPMSEVATGQPADPVAGTLADEATLQLWVPHPYTETRPADVVQGKAPEAEMPFPDHVVTGLTGMRELGDRLLNLFEGHNRLGDLPGEQVRTLCDEIPARITETMNNPQGLARTIIDDGKPVAVVRIRSRLRRLPDGSPDATLVGTASDYFLERIGIEYADTTGVDTTTHSGHVGLTATPKDKDLMIAGGLPTGGVDRPGSWYAGNKAETSAYRVVPERQSGYTQAYQMGVEFEVTVERPPEFDVTKDAAGGSGDVHSFQVLGNGLFRLTARHAYDLGLLVDKAAVQVDTDGTVKVDEHGACLLRDDPDPAPPPGRLPKLPEWLGRDGIPGAGHAVVEIVSGVDGPDGLREKVKGLLQEVGILDEAGTPPLSRDLIAVNSRRAIEDFLSSLTPQRFGSVYSQAAQDGVLVDLDSAQQNGSPKYVTLRIRVVQDYDNTKFRGHTYAKKVVILNIGSDSSAHSAGASRGLDWSGKLTRSVKLGTDWAGQTSGSGSGTRSASRGHDLTTGGTVNQAPLGEGTTETAIFEIPHTFVVELLGPDGAVVKQISAQGAADILLPAGLLPREQHPSPSSGSTGRSDADPNVELRPRQAESLAHSAESLPHRTAQSVLDRATVLDMDTRGVWHAVEEALPLGSRPGSAGHQALASFASLRSMLAHPELLFRRDAYRADIVVGLQHGRARRSSLAIYAEPGPSEFLDATDGLTLGDINFTMVADTLTTTWSRGRSGDYGLGGAVQSGTDGPLPPGLYVDGASDFSAAVSRGESEWHTAISGDEKLGIYTRAYLLRTEVGLHFTGIEHQLLHPVRREVALPGRTVVYALPEVEALELYVTGELPLPPRQVADVLTRYAEGRLALDRHTAAELMKRYQQEWAEAEPETMVAPADLPNLRTPGPVVQGLAERLAAQYPEVRLPPEIADRDAAQRLRYLLLRTEGLPANKPGDNYVLPEHLRNDAGLSLLTRATLTYSDGERVDLAEEAHRCIDQVAPHLDQRAPGVRSRLSGEFAGKRWVGKLPAMLRGGFVEVFSVPFGRFGIEQVKLRITATFGEATPLGPASDVGGIEQHYAYKQAGRSESVTRAYGVGVSGDATRGADGFKLPAGIASNFTYTSTGAAESQQTQMDRVAFFNGVDQMGRQFTLHVEVTRSVPRPARQPGLYFADLVRGIGLPRHGESTLGGSLVQLVPRGVLGPERPWLGSEQNAIRPVEILPADSAVVPLMADPRKVVLPDIFAVGSVDSPGLLKAVQRLLARPDLLGAAGVREYEAELEQELSALKLDATLKQVASPGGYVLARLPVPGHPERFVEVRVQADVSHLREVVSDYGEVQLGQINRMQRTSTQSDNRVYLPVAANLSEATLLHANKHVEVDAAAGAQASLPSGNRDESSNHESGPAAIGEVRLTYHLTAEVKDSVWGGGTVTRHQVHQPFAADGQARITLFVHSLTEMQRQMEEAGGSPLDWRFLADQDEVAQRGPGLLAWLHRRDVQAPTFDFNDLLGLAGQRHGLRLDRVHEDIADVLREKTGKVLAGRSPIIRFVADAPGPADPVDPLTAARLVATELHAEVRVELRQPDDGAEWYRAMPDGQLVAELPGSGLAAAHASLPPELINDANQAGLDLRSVHSAYLKEDAGEHRAFTDAVRGQLATLRKAGQGQMDARGTTQNPIAAALATGSAHRTLTEHRAEALSELDNAAQYADSTLVPVQYDARSNVPQLVQHALDSARLQIYQARAELSEAMTTLGAIDTRSGDHALSTPFVDEMHRRIAAVAERGTRIVATLDSVDHAARQIRMHLDTNSTDHAVASIPLLTQATDALTSATSGMTEVTARLDDPSGPLHAAHQPDAEQAGRYLYLSGSQPPEPGAEPPAPEPLVVGHQATVDAIERLRQRVLDAGAEPDAYAQKVLEELDWTRSVADRLFLAEEKWYGNYLGFGLKRLTALVSGLHESSRLADLLNDWSAGYSMDGLTATERAARHADLAEKLHRRFEPLHEINEQLDALGAFQVPAAPPPAGLTGYGQLEQFWVRPTKHGVMFGDPHDLIGTSGLRRLAALPVEPGYFQILGHGAGGRFLLGVEQWTRSPDGTRWQRVNLGGDRLDGHQLAAIIKGIPAVQEAVQEGRRMLLEACEAGLPGPDGQSVAEQLADELGVRVKAPLGDVQVDPVTGALKVVKRIPLAAGTEQAPPQFLEEPLPESQAWADFEPHTTGLRHQDHPAVQSGDRHRTRVLPELAGKRLPTHKTEDPDAPLSLGPSFRPDMTPCTVEGTVPEPSKFGVYAVRNAENGQLLGYGVASGDRGDIVADGWRADRRIVDATTDAHKFIVTVLGVSGDESAARAAASVLAEHWPGSADPSRGPGLVLRPRTAQSVFPPAWALGPDNPALGGLVPLDAGLFAGVLGGNLPVADLTVADLRFDDAGRALSLGQQRVEFTERRWAMLDDLRQHINEVRTPDDLARAAGLGDTGQVDNEMAYVQAKVDGVGVNGDWLVRQVANGWMFFDASGTPSHEAGPLHLFRDAQALFIGDDPPRALTTSQARLLALLLDHPEHALSLDILAAAWPTEMPPTPEQMQEAMRDLQTALGDRGPRMVYAAGDSYGIDPHGNRSPASIPQPAPTHAQPASGTPDESREQPTVPTGHLSAALGDIGVKCAEISDMLPAADAAGVDNLRGMLAQISDQARAIAKAAEDPDEPHSDVLDAALGKLGDRLAGIARTVRAHTQTGPFGEMQARNRGAGGLSWLSFVQRMASSGDELSAAQLLVKVREAAAAPQQGLPDTDGLADALDMVVEAKHTVEIEIRNCSPTNPLEVLKGLYQAATDIEVLPDQIGNMGRAQELARINGRLLPMLRDVYPVIDDARNHIVQLLDLVEQAQKAATNPLDQTGLLHRATVRAADLAVLLGRFATDVRDLGLMVQGGGDEKSFVLGLAPVRTERARLAQLLADLSAPMGQLNATPPDDGIDQE